MPSTRAGLEALHLVPRIPRIESAWILGRLPITENENAQPTGCAVPSPESPEFGEPKTDPTGELFGGFGGGFTRHIRVWNAPKDSIGKDVVPAECRRRDGSQTPATGQCRSPARPASESHWRHPTTAPWEIPFARTAPEELADQRAGHWKDASAFPQNAGYWRLQRLI